MGAALVLLYWVVERTSARLGRRGSFVHGVVVGVAGMILRLALVLGALVGVGLLDRPAFPDAALSFLATYSLYQVVRLLAHPALPRRPDEPRGETVKHG